MYTKAPDLQTERLTLRPYRPDDLDVLVALYGAPDVAARTKLGVRTPRQCADILEDYLSCWRERGYGMRVLIDGAGHAIGECGLFHNASGYAPAIRYVLHTTHWGKGYAGEAVAATLEDGFTRLRAERIYGFVERGNDASERVLERAGFVLEAVSDSAKGALMRFALDRDKWRAERQN